MKIKNISKKVCKTSVRENAKKALLYENSLTISSNCYIINTISKNKRITYGYGLKGDGKQEGVTMEAKKITENGSNELELLEFRLNDNSYGIAVEKVREIIDYYPVTPVPNAHASVEGVFMPRDKMITAIDLKQCLGLGVSQQGGNFIVTDFSGTDIALHVEAVVGIHRVPVSDIVKAGSAISMPLEGNVAGALKYNDKLIILIDSERIARDIESNMDLEFKDLVEMGTK